MIVEAEKGMVWPMFGCGCSSTLFNEMRDAKIRAQYAPNFQKSGV
jgi:hypothetical protein